MEGDFLARFAHDMIGFGPASTPGRELLAAVVQIGLVLVLLFVLFPDRLPDPVKLILTGAAAAYFVVRLVIGLPRWRRRRTT